MCVCSKRPLAARHDGRGADLAAASASASGSIDNPGGGVTSGTGGSRKGGEVQQQKAPLFSPLVAYTRLFSIR
ncbi:hypothetical protein CGRA01v4_13599 [Colletotrichum graminicola]|nr:hypothetical protein CGRA01v4_13599 [Colletotrichum graminicola]